MVGQEENGGFIPIVVAVLLIKVLFGGVYLVLTFQQEIHRCPGKVACKCPTDNSSSVHALELDYVLLNVTYQFDGL